MYLVISGIVFADNLLHKLVEAVIDAHKIPHGSAGQEPQNWHEVCRIAAAHHLAKLFTQVHQAEKLLIIVVIASAKAHSTDHIGNGHNDVAEGVEAAIGLHDVVQLFDQILSLFADVLLQHAAVLRGLALQGGERAKGTVGQLSAGSPDARLVRTEGQTLAIIDELEAVKVRPSCKLFPLLDESLPHHVVTTQHNNRTHANLDLKHRAVALAHGCQTQIRFVAHLKHISNDRQRLRSREPTKPLRNLSAEKLEDQVDQTHCCHGHQTLRHRH